MEWEKRLKELNGYNISFEIKQGYYHIALVYDDGWDVLIPDNENIYVENRNGFYHYIGSIDAISIDDLFNSIEETIAYNMDLQKKLILFKQKTQELQEIFSNEDYETLKNLKFTFEKEKVKKTTKKTKAKTQEKEKTAKKTTKRTKKEKVEPQLEEKKELEGIKDEITQLETTDYDANDEIVTMSNEYFQELER